MIRNDYNKNLLHMNGVNRRTAVRTIERQSFGGSYINAMTYFRMFQNYSPQDFGVMSTARFSSTLAGSKMNKKFTYLTAADGCMYWTPPAISTYTWKLVASPRVEFIFRPSDIQPTDQVGKGNQPFKFRLNMDWIHEPVILKLQGDDLPLVKIIGHPTRINNNSFEYTGELQDSDPNSWIPGSYFQDGMTCIDIATSVADELNTKYGGQQFSEMHKLEGKIGLVGRKAEVTDKMIKAEMYARQKNMRMGAGYDKDKSVGTGYLWRQSMRNGEGEVVQADHFISALEARLEEKVQMDREMLMEFGRNQTTRDVDSQNVIRVAPGWRQISAD